MSEPGIPPQTYYVDYATGQQAPQTFIERLGKQYVLFGIVVLFIILFLYQVFGGTIIVLAFGLDLKKANVTGLRIATGLGQILFILIPTLFLVRLASFKPSQYLRIKKPNILAIFLAIIGIFSLQQILQVYLYFQEKIPLPKLISEFKDQFEQMFQESYKALIVAHSIPELLLVIVVIACIPAIAEEFLFRGLVQRSFEKELNPYLSFMLTGIIFGYYHLNPFSVVPLATLGVYLGFIAMRGDSIWVSVAGHFFNNAVACIAVYMNVDDEALLTGDPEKLAVSEVLGLFVVMAIVFAISTYLFWRVTRPAQVVSTPQITEAI